MKFHQLFKSTVAALACAGTLIPGSLVQAGETTSKTEAKKPASIMRDLSLTSEGVLQGQVSTAKKTAATGVVVSIRQKRKEVHRTKTDALGRFEVRDIKPGTYYIIAGTGHGLYRVWANTVAPPKALKSARIVSDRTIVRGNGEPDGSILYDENGVAYGQVRIVDNGGLVPVSPGATFGPSTGFLDSLGLYDVLILGGVGAGIGLGAAALADDDDNNNTNN